MLGISQGTLNFFGIIIVALIGLLGVIITNRGNKKVESVKEDTSQINNAVNHVEPGLPTMTQRVDLIREDMDTVKLKAIEAAKIVDERFDTVEQKIDGFTDVVNGLMIMHVKTSEDITSIREAVDNRKNSFRRES
jgi:predicted  nucleic acid-binding Zn-ribbon protein